MPALTEDECKALKADIADLDDATMVGYSSDVIDLLIEHAVDRGRQLTPYSVRSITENGAKEVMEFN
jgi:hypothetical protein